MWQKVARKARRPLGSEYSSPSHTTSVDTAYYCNTYSIYLIYPRLRIEERTYITISNFFLVIQLMKIAFDEEVNTENVETLRKLINKVRNPPSVMNTFAFTGYIYTQPSQLTKKEKNASLK